MKFSKCVKHAFNMVIHSKLRSWLTILGIIIGIASVITISAMGKGMTSSIDSQMSDLGINLITLTPGGNSRASMMGMQRGGFDIDFQSSLSSSSSTSTPVLNKKDVNTLKTISEIESVNTQISGRVDVSYMGESGTTSVTGVDSQTWSDFLTSDLSQGRLLSSSDTNVIVVGGRFSSSFFSKELVINKMITIEGKSFRIVGILDDNSNSIYMPISQAYNVIEDITKDEYQTIMIKVNEKIENLTEVEEKIEAKLLISRNVKEENKDFSLSSNQDMNSTRNEMMSTMSLFLTGIAAISLIVGAIGVANSMFTSVLEKTKDIGIMKAIGAKNKDITIIFLLNSAFIGLVGGLFGVILGMFVSTLLPKIISDIPMVSSGLVTIDIVLIALIVSILSGIISGLIPAYKASRLKPVDALRSD